MEDGLRDVSWLFRHILKKNCLNPCSCGGWSQRKAYCLTVGIGWSVLILVLVEDGLRVFVLLKQNLECLVLILVLVEDGLRDE